MKKYLAFLTASFGCSLFANAGWLLEPEVGYSAGSNMSFTTGGVNYTDASTSVPVGLRAAWVASNGFFVGIDGAYFASGSLAETTGASKNDTSSFTRTTGGIELGYISSRGFKVYAGYDAVDNISITPSTTDLAAYPTALNGTGIHIGLGYYFKPHFGVSLLYTTPTYTSGAKGSTTYTSLGVANFSNISDSSAAILLTFPFLAK